MLLLLLLLVVTRLRLTYRDVQVLPLASFVVRRRRNLSVVWLAGRLAGTCTHGTD